MESVRRILAVAVLLVATHAAAQVVHLPPGSPIPPPGTYPPGTAVYIGGTAVMAGSASSTSSPAMDAARSSGTGTNQDARSFGSTRGGFGGMGMQIQGGGIGLPKGVTEQQKTREERAKEEEEKQKAASTSPGNPSRTGPAGGGNAPLEKTRGEGGTGDGAANALVVTDPNRKPGGDSGTPQGKDPKDGDTSRNDDGKRRDPSPGLTPVKPQPPSTQPPPVAVVPPSVPPATNPMRPPDDRASPRNLGPEGPTDTRIRGTAVGVPKCFENSREGVGCQ